MKIIQNLPIIEVQRILDEIYKRIDELEKEMKNGPRLFTGKNKSKDPKEGDLWLKE